MDPDKLLLIGKIFRPHGIRGEVRVSAYVDQQLHLQPGSRVIVEAPDQQPAEYSIETARSHKNGLLIGFAGVGDRSSAEAVSGASLFMPRSALPPAEPDTWYWCDLIGLAVYETGGGFLGRVESMIETGSNDVFVVRHGQNERLIPAIEQVVREINLEDGKMVVDLPEGL
ncbi:MAG: ribosome maturation factor RimM [Desulfosalsimonas sp.]|uniref:ribosome maturation factor RimM n=1 Tax=Desulfosalsimonas sp. TaxID=3073848 RepID=UPI0039710DAA